MSARASQQIGMGWQATGPGSVISNRSDPGDPGGNRENGSGSGSGSGGGCTIGTDNKKSRSVIAGAASDLVVGPGFPASNQATGRRVTGFIGRTGLAVKEPQCSIGYERGKQVCRAG